MGGRILVAGAFYSVAILTQIQGQVVEVPRDEGAKSGQQHVEAEGLIEQAEVVRPADALNAIEQTNSAPDEKPMVAQSEPASGKPTIEQMRKAGALAAQRVKNEARAEQTRTAD